MTVPARPATGLPALSPGKKLLFAGLVCGLALLVLELGLWLAGTPTLLERGDPFRGFSRLVSVFERDGDRYRTAKQTRHVTFNEQSFLAQKPAGGLRAFCLGGSSSYGYPWGAEAAFPALLEHALRAELRGREVEVVNASGISYAVHRLLILVHELLEYEPDWLIVYSGHNEFVERGFFDELRGRGAATNRLEYALSHSRLYSALSALVDPAAGAPEAGPGGQPFEAFVERNESRIWTQDEKRAVVAEYEQSLRRILALARERGVRCVLCTVPANLRDWSPNRSLVGAALDPDREAELSGRLGAAARALESGEAAAALAELERARDIAPARAETHFRLGRAYEALGRFDEAGAAYAAACDLDASPIRRLSGVNDAIRRVASEEGCLLVDVEAALERESEHGLVGFNWIEDYVHPTLAGHRRIAREIWTALAEAGWIELPEPPAPERFEALLADRPALERARNGTWYFNQGCLFEHSGQDERALEMYRQALVVEPLNYGALLGLARLSTELGRLEESLGYSDRILGLAPEDARGLLERGAALARLGRSEEAEEAFRRARESDPGRLEATIGLASVLAERGELEEAERWLADVLRREPEQQDALLAKARIERQRGDARRAQQTLRGLLALYPDSLAGHLALSNLLVETDSGAAALPVLESAAELLPDPRRGAVQIGQGFLAAGAPERAAALLERLLRVEPDHLQAHALLARACERLERWEQAERHYLRAVQLGPRAADLTRLGLFLNGRGRAEEAIRRFTEALALREEDAETHVLLGGALLNAGRASEGIAHLERALELEPGHARAQAWLARARAAEPDRIEGGRR